MCESPICRILRKKRFEKKIAPAAKTGIPVVKQEFQTQREQNLYVIQEILRLHREGMEYTVFRQVGTVSYPILNFTDRMKTGMRRNSSVNLSGIREYTEMVCVNYLTEAA